MRPTTRFTATARLTSPSKRRWLQHTACLVPAVMLSPLLTACGSGDDDDAPRYPQRQAVAPTPILASLNNFRDVAGADDAHAYRTSDGYVLQRGVFYRANELVVSAEDLAYLNSLKIQTIYDLRTPGERTKKPNQTVEGAKVVEINLIGREDVSLSDYNAATAEEMIALLVEGNKKLVTDAGVRERTGQFFKQLAASNGVQLYHCTAGKDRTGWVSAVLLLLLGVPEATVIEDFLLSNTYMAEQIARSYQYLSLQDQAMADALHPAMGVVEEVLVSAIAEMKRLYNTPTGFVRDGLGLSKAEIQQLKDKLLRTS